jgi:hypothetical protein
VLLALDVMQVNYTANRCRGTALKSEALPSGIIQKEREVPRAKKPRFSEPMRRRLRKSFTNLIRLLPTGGLLTTEKALDEANQPMLKGHFESESRIEYRRSTFA